MGITRRSTSGSVGTSRTVSQCEGLMSDTQKMCDFIFSPLLPVVKEKDRWKFYMYGVPYKVRLCLDLKQSGYNDTIHDWPFRYRSLDAIAEKIHKGDWLATVDISRFYLRLPAGRKLRNAQ